MAGLRVPSGGPSHARARLSRPTGGLQSAMVESLLDSLFGAIGGVSYLAALIVLRRRS
jgi:hypothetical protein